MFMNHFAAKKSQFTLLFHKKQIYFWGNRKIPEFW